MLELLGVPGGSTGRPPTSWVYPPLLDINIIWPLTSKHPNHTNFWVGVIKPPPHLVQFEHCTMDSETSVIMRFQCSTWNDDKKTKKRWKLQIITSQRCCRILIVSSFLLQVRGSASARWISCDPKLWARWVRCCSPSCPLYVPNNLLLVSSEPSIIWITMDPVLLRSIPGSRYRRAIPKNLSVFPQLPLVCRKVSSLCSELPVLLHPPLEWF